MTRTPSALAIAGVVGVTTLSLAAPVVGAPSPAREHHPPVALYGVSATSARDVWAAGFFSTEFGGEIVSHWTGDHWSNHQAGGAGGRSFGSNNEISVAGPEDIWVAGAFGDPDGCSGRFIIHRTHTGWHLVRIACTNDRWLSISALRHEGAFALGTQGDAARVWSEVDGVRRHVQVDGAMQSISMVSTTDGWIAGGDESAHFDGQSWTDVAVAGSDPDLISVSATGTAAWAVGSQGSDKLVEHEVGGVWSLVTLPRAVRSGSLVSVSATGSDSVWALGLDGTGATVAVHWDGATWQQSILDSTRLGTMTPYGIVGVPGAIWAVGQASHGAFREYWDGSGWHIT